MEIPRTSTVEALIEGQLTEKQLIQAESSETSNRALLKRLETDGFDGSGEPLFPGIDQLEQLLEKATDQSIRPCYKAPLKANNKEP